MQRFLGKVVEINNQKHGAWIRPAYAPNRPEEDLFCSFSESCKLDKNMNVSFEIKREDKTGRWAACRVSPILDGAIAERPEWLPSALSLSLMRQTWTHTKNKEDVLAIEKEYFNGMNNPKDINTKLDELGMNIRL